MTFSLERIFGKGCWDKRGPQTFPAQGTASRQPASPSGAQPPLLGGKGDALWTPCEPLLEPQGEAVTPLISPTLSEVRMVAFILALSTHTDSIFSRPQIMTQGQAQTFV